MISAWFEGCNFIKHAHSQVYYVTCVHGQKTNIGVDGLVQLQEYCSIGSRYLVALICKRPERLVIVRQYQLLEGFRFCFFYRRVTINSLTKRYDVSVYFPLTDWRLKFGFGFCKPWTLMYLERQLFKEKWMLLGCDLWVCSLSVHSGKKKSSPEQILCCVFSVA